MADRKISDLTALTTPATGDLIPIVDISEAAAADKNKSITVGELLRGAPDGTAAAPGIAFESDGGNGMFLGGTDILAFSTGGTQAVTIDASQRVGIGTSSPIFKLHVVDTSATTNAPVIVQSILAQSSGTVANGFGPRIRFEGEDSGGSNRDMAYISSVFTDATNIDTALTFSTRDNLGALTEHLRIDPVGNVGIGTTSPNRLLHLSGAADNYIGIERTGATTSALLLGVRSGATAIISRGSDISSTDVPLAFETGNTERARIDSSGRLLVGTSTAATTDNNANSPNVQLEGADGDASRILIRSNAGTTATAGPVFYLARSRGTTANSKTAVAQDDFLGSIVFEGTDGTHDRRAAAITAFVDGGVSTNDMPGRLVFSTTADGASSPTERMRITESGTVLIGQAATINGEALILESTSDNASLGTLYVLNDQNTASHPAAAFATAVNSTATTNVLVKFGINSYNSGSGQINANGAGQCAFGSFSDERLKENIIDLPSQWENIKNLRPVEFDYIESQGGEHQIGFIAQEFENVYPDAVGSSPMFVGAEEASDEERLTLTGWSKTEARLVKALQEAIAKIETLEAKVAALEAN